MAAEITEPVTRFSDRVIRFLDRVEHRIARTEAEKEEVFKLRYDAYIRNDLISEREDHQLRDCEYDYSNNSFVTTTYIDGELAGTTRVNVGVDVNAKLPCLGVFSDQVMPYLKAGKTVIELTRTAARLDFSGLYPELPYITLRPAFLAAEYFDADFAIATARAEHLAFFHRIFRFKPWCEPRDYPGVTTQIVCMGSDFRAGKNAVATRFPFFRSTPEERAKLFAVEDATSEPAAPKAPRLLSA
jgi:hypothetical protein